ncbi:MAG: cupredoxin domain-containing protein [Candidatus Eremiobacteraeota bacterium]|nr:cupredoxin domain-containing protein [Candidatus Eremiobacteraeota bacterium]
MAQNGKVASAPAPTAVVAQSATPVPAPAGAAAAIVQAKGFKFLPASLTVAAGTTVTFVNEDEAQHSFTAVDKTNGKPNFDSGELSKGGKWTHVFAKAGTYEYFCDDHAFMKGKIVVTAPSS